MDTPSCARCTGTTHPRAKKVKRSALWISVDMYIYYCTTTRYSVHSLAVYLSQYITQPEAVMYLAERIRQVREAKHLSQGDIETRTGLLRCYVSRVENGHTVPSLETLEKFARALELPLYHLMFDGDKPPVMPKAAKYTSEDSLESSRSGALLMKKLVSLLAKMDQEDRNLILFLAGRVSKKQGGMKAGRKPASSAVA